MSQAQSPITSLKTVGTFMKRGACSETLLAVLDGAYGHPMPDEESASQPLAGGILQHGYQCGMLWGAALAAGAQAHRLLGAGPEAEAKTIAAARRVVDSFRELNDATNCVEGSVELVVVRPEPGARLTPARGRLTPEAGLEGDRWIQREAPLLAAQVSVMRVDVARALADGRPLELFGDNLLVDLDLAADNLPVGARVRVGAALCEVTDKPHTGCAKFAERFGPEARELLSAERFAAWRLRGIYVRVIEAGEVGPGDRVRVISRGGAAA